MLLMLGLDGNSTNKCGIFHHDISCLSRFFASLLFTETNEPFEQV